MEELRVFLERASLEAQLENNVLKNVHACWCYFGDRWQEADKHAVTELKKYVGVIAVIGKKDTRSAQRVESLRSAIEVDLGSSVFITEVGSPQGTKSWISDSHGEEGHTEEDLEISLRN